MKIGKGISILLILSMILVPFNTTTMAQEGDSGNPLYPIDYVSQSITPVTDGDRQYYVVEPGTLADDVMFQGSTGNFDSTGGGSGTYLNNDLIGSSFRTDVSSSPGHPLYDTEDFARGVGIESYDDVNLETSTQRPIDLIDDASVTVNDFTIFLTDNDTNQMVLDISHSGQDLGASLYAPWFGYVDNSNWKDVCSRTSIPLIRLNSTNTNQMPIYVDSSSPTTVTPHFVSAEQFAAPMNMTGNSTYSFEVTQGDLSPDSIDRTSQLMFNMHPFQFNLEAGSSYSWGHNGYDLISSNWIEDEMGGQCTDQYSFENLEYNFVEGEDYEKFTDPVTGKSLIHAIEDMTVNYYIVSQGPMSKSMTVFIEQFDEDRRDEITEPEIVPNNFNTIVEDTYYKLELNQDSVIAINTSLFTDDDFFIYHEREDGSRKYLTSYDSHSGNLDENSLDKFHYLPAGTYFYYRYSGSPDDFFFTVIEIQNIGSISVAHQKFTAVSIEQNVNTYNMVNMTYAGTNDQFGADYAFASMSKFQQFSMVQDTDITDFGNVTLSNVFDNQTTLLPDSYPLSEWESEYIVLLYPYNGYNETHTLEDFTTTVSITNTEISDTVFQDLFGDYYYRPAGRGPGSATLTIDDAKFDNSNSLFLYQPLNLDPYQLYNVSFFLNGNYTNTDFNGSIFNYAIYSGNLGSALWDDTFDFVNSQNGSILMLTQTARSYLYLDLTRIGGRNFTLTIDVRSLDAPALPDEPDFLYEGIWNSNYVNGSEDFLMEYVGEDQFSRGFLAFDTVGTYVLIFSTLMITTYIVRRRSKV